MKIKRVWIICESSKSDKVRAKMAMSFTGSAQLRGRVARSHEHRSLLRDGVSFAFYPAVERKRRACPPFDL